MNRLVTAALVALVSAPLFAQAPTVSGYWILDVGTIIGTPTLFKVNNGGAMIWNSNGHAFIYQNCQSRDLGSLGGGTTTARGIGPDGSVVGTSRNASGKQRAFGYAAGQMRDLGGGAGSLVIDEATATNFWGDVVGVQSVQGGLALTAVRYQDGGAWPMAPISVSGQLARIANVVDLNDSRMVLGSFSPSPGRLTAVLSSNLGYQWTTVRGLAGLESFTTPRAMNRYGHITGAAGADVSTRAFLSRNPALPAGDLGTLDGGVSVGLGINSYDFVVGTASALELPSRTRSMHAFVHDGTTMTDLNTRVMNGAGWRLEEASAINDAGVIVGVGSKGGAKHAFMALPMASYPLRPPCSSRVVSGGPIGVLTK